MYSRMTIGMLCGLALLTAWMVYYLLGASDGSWPDMLRDYGEFLAILGGGVLLMFQIVLDRNKERQAKQEDQLQKKRTARYWVFYNASNRVSQDLGVVREIYAAQKDFDNQYKDRSTTQKLDRYASILKGFKQTWENDDILNSALSFEFSLLTRPEKRAILDYFANYNEIEDRISLKLPLLMPEENEKRPDTRTMTVEDENELKDLIESLYDSLGSLIEQGIELMELLQYVDKFPGFARRMEHYRAEATNTAPPGKGLTMNQELPTALEPLEIDAIMTERVDPAHVEELKAEKRFIENNPQTLKRIRRRYRNFAS